MLLLYLLLERGRFYKVELARGLRGCLRNAESSGFQLSGGELLMYRGRQVVPDEDTLRTRVIEELLNRITSARPGQSKTRQKVAAQFLVARHECGC